MGGSRPKDPLGPRRSGVDIISIWKTKQIHQQQNVSVKMYKEGMFMKTVRHRGSEILFSHLGQHTFPNHQAKSRYDSSMYNWSCLRDEAHCWAHWHSLSE